MRAICLDCGGPRELHLQSWSEAVSSPAARLGALLIPKRLEALVGRLLDRVMMAVGVLKSYPIKREEVPMRAWVFSEAARRRDIAIEALGASSSYRNYFRMSVSGRSYTFEGLPGAEFLSQKNWALMDDKAFVKNELSRYGFPVPEGRAFTLWQKERALRYGESLGFPLVVKPRSGSYSRHVTTNVRDSVELRDAIRNAIEYAPSFIIERYIETGSVARLTVVDFELVGALRRIHPHVIGDGVSSINELIRKKNADPRRGPPDREEFVLFQIADDARVDRYLKLHQKTRRDVPRAGEMIQLHHDPFIRLGADSEELLEAVHPDVWDLVSRVARLFDTRLVGIDVIAEDLTRSWKDQQFYILELNSAPCIEVHHEPTYGTPSDAAGRLAEMVLKYY